MNCNLLTATAQVSDFMQLCFDCAVMAIVPRGVLHVVMQLS